jgi:hypothetical protein
MINKRICMNRWTVQGEKPHPVPLCLPQIPYWLAWNQGCSSAERRRRLHVWVLARPCSGLDTWHSAESGRITDVSEKRLPSFSGLNLRRHHISLISRQISLLPRDAINPKSYTVKYSHAENLESVFMLFTEWTSCIIFLKYPCWF